jgi:hypothetical protein
MSPQEVARKRAYGHYAAASCRTGPEPPRADARVAQSAYWQTLAGGAGTAQPGAPELMPAARSACSAAAQFEPSHQQVPSGAQYPDRWARGGLVLRGLASKRLRSRPFWMSGGAWTVPGRSARSWGLHRCRHRGWAFIMVLPYAIR